MKRIYKEALVEHLTEILTKLAPTKGTSISLSARLQEDLGLESLEQLELKSRVCERYEVDLKYADDIGDMLAIRTVGEIVEWLEKLSRKAPGA